LRFFIRDDLDAVQHERLLPSRPAGLIRDLPCPVNPL